MEDIACVFINKYILFLGHLHNHVLSSFTGAEYKRRRCVGCYKKLTAEFGRIIASNKAKQINTYCASCFRSPHYCQSCFDEKHFS